MFLLTVVYLKGSKMSIKRGVIVSFVLLTMAYLLCLIVSPSPCNPHYHPSPNHVSNKQTIPTVVTQHKEEVSKVTERENQNNYFSFKIPLSFKREPYSQALKSWRKSLIKNIGYQEAKINSETFLQTDIVLKMDGETIEKQIYQSRKNPNRFYLLNSSVIVDFSTSQVGTMGVSGISSHLTPSKRMIVVLAPSKHINLLGVLLSFSDKTEVPKPTFQGKEVKFYWHDWTR